MPRAETRLAACPVGFLICARGRPTFPPVEALINSLVDRTFCGPPSDATRLLKGKTARLSRISTSQGGESTFLNVFRLFSQEWLSMLYVNEASVRGRPPRPGKGDDIISRVARKTAHVRCTGDIVYLLGHSILAICVLRLTQESLRRTRTCPPSDLHPSSRGGRRRSTRRFEAHLEPS